jgi:hypothetical protein
MQLSIEQALFGSRDASGYSILARSPGLREECLPAVERLCGDFGNRPAGVRFQSCFFARPLDSRYIAIVRVIDNGSDNVGRPATFLFHLLILSKSLYANLGGDPFFIADRFPVPSEATGELPTLLWTDRPLAPRTVAQLRKVLDVPHSPVLLGGTQALLDGGRLVFERNEPADDLVRSIWALLPTNSRCGLWPATFAFANAANFHVAVVPRSDDPVLAEYVDEERAGDYPEGRYELALQMAVEDGDQPRLDALLSRRSRRQVFQLGLALLCVLTFAPALVARFVPRPESPTTPRRGTTEKLHLPAKGECPRLDASERAALAARIAALGQTLGVAISRGDSDDAVAAELAALDSHLGTPDPARDPGPLHQLGPIQLQVRALLWKHSVSGYDAPGANTVELLDKLSGQLGGKAAKRVVPRFEPAEPAP